MEPLRWTPVLEAPGRAVDKDRARLYGAVVPMVDADVGVAVLHQVMAVSVHARGVADVGLPVVGVCADDVGDCFDVIRLLHNKLELRSSLFTFDKA